MPYEIPATSKTPALIIYLLDVSASMSEPIGGGSQSRLDIVNAALDRVLTRMVQRSTKGSSVSPRYRVAMFAYSDTVTDLLGGVHTIDEVVKTGVPNLTPLRNTDTASAFVAAEQLLAAELPSIQHCPAPLVCHMTDGEYNGADPHPVVQRILNMSVPDGNVLVENIYVGAVGLNIPDVSTWPGISEDSQLPDEYSQKLFHMSSVIPERYCDIIQEFGYDLAAGARLLFPGSQPEIVELGFAMSGATPITPG